MAVVEKDLELPGVNTEIVALPQVGKIDAPQMIVFTTEVLPSIVTHEFTVAVTKLPEREKRGIGESTDIYVVRNPFDGRTVKIGGVAGHVLQCLQHASPDNPMTKDQLVVETGSIKVAQHLSRIERYLPQAGIKVGRLYSKEELARGGRLGIQQGYWLQLNEETLQKIKDIAQETDEVKKARRIEVTMLLTQIGGKRLTYKKYLPRTIQAFCDAYIEGNSLTMEGLSWLLEVGWGTRKAVSTVYDALHLADTEVFRPLNWKIKKLYETGERTPGHTKQRYTLEKNESPSSRELSVLASCRGCISRNSAAIILNLLEGRENVRVYKGNKELFTFGRVDDFSLCPWLVEIKNSVGDGNSLALSNGVLKEVRQVAIRRLKTLIRRGSQGKEISCANSENQDGCLIRQAADSYDQYGEAFFQALNAPIETTVMTERVSKNGASVIRKITKEVKLSVKGEAENYVPSKTVVSANTKKGRTGLNEVGKVERSQPVEDYSWLLKELKRVKEEERLAIQERMRINKEQGLYYDPRWLTLIGLKRVMIERALNSLGAGY